ncbi:MAG: hypothetical protein LDLANPLL_02398 [Turneriella sp.]|nr:hypothetical protein [Turneriella sp.]
MEKKLIPIGFFWLIFLCACQVPDGENFPPTSPKKYDGSVVFTGTSGLTVTENGQSASFTINLTKSPIGTMTIGLGSASGELTFSPPTINLNATNWQLLQPITITAVDDSVVQGMRTVNIHPIVTGDDPEFLNMVFSDIPVTVTDDDTGGIAITVSSGNTTITEDGVTDQFFVQLTAIPLQDVTVVFENPNPTRIVISPPTYALTTAAWGTTITVNVSAINDAIAQGNTTETVTVRTVSTQSAFNNLTAPVVVNLIDND